MVNKQYTIQQQQQQNTKFHGKRFSPLPIRNLSSNNLNVSDVPNPGIENIVSSSTTITGIKGKYKPSTHYVDRDRDDLCNYNRNEDLITPTAPQSKSASLKSFTSFDLIDEQNRQNVYTRNISLYGHNHHNYQLNTNNISTSNNSSNEKEMNYDNKDVKGEENENHEKSIENNKWKSSIKESSIHEIGRFQYILQMDKEMGINSTLQRVPASSSSSPPSSFSPSSSSLPASNGSSINSSHHFSTFWKAGSQSPINNTSSQKRNGKASSRYVHRQELLFKHLKDFWKYAKWPFILIMICILLGALIFYHLPMENTSRNDTTIEIYYDNYLKDKTETTSSFIDNVDIKLSQDDNKLDDNIQPELESGDSYQENKMKTIERTLEQTTETLTTLTTADISQSDVELVTVSTGKQSPMKPTNPSPPYFRKVTSSVPFRNTQILKISSPKGGVVLDEDEDYLSGNVRSTTESIDKAINKTDINPTKDSYHPIGFTSGHQNNFGIPIEEDERILKILNDELIKYEQENSKKGEHEQQHYQTTDASIFKTRVSPTLPVIFHKETAMNSQSFSATEATNSTNAGDVGICESTSLGICRGILHYDLTISKSKRKLNSLELEHFKYLFDSKCSARATEFVCSALEPECRPQKMGILQPCKRICKSILEPCASIIASSEILTMTFDCDRYPDSSDRNVCEDPTRRGRCHDNEFKCLDSTCIPQQWRCDNIKDCSLGEDEENCLFCEHEEFRCQTNDKCIPDKWRCDQYDDCPDGSDEIDCYEYEDDPLINNDDSDSHFLTSSDEFNGHSHGISYPSHSTRIYPFASIQSPDDPNSKPYLTISNEDIENDESFDNFNVNINKETNHSSTRNNSENVNNKNQSQSTENENDSVDSINKNDQNNSNNDNTDSNNYQDNNNDDDDDDDVDENSDEIQKGEASGRIIIGLPKNLANFQDSKEIMMTSDSENDFKYSTITNRTNRFPSTVTTRKTTVSTRFTTSRIIGASPRTPTTLASSTATVSSSSSVKPSSSSISSSTSESYPQNYRHYSPHCPENQLRCISGDCIDVSQICDRTIDCPDGADEAMCVYKENS